jgi:hypothetical protein
MEPAGTIRTKDHSHVSSQIANARTHALNAQNPVIPDEDLAASAPDDAKLDRLARHRPSPRARKLQNEPNFLRPRITFWKPTSTSQARIWKKAPSAAFCVITSPKLSKQHRQ